MRLPSIRADLRSITPYLVRLRSFPENLILGAPQNSFWNCSCILCKRQTHCWCLLRLRQSRSNDSIGITSALAQFKRAKWFFTNGFFIKYTRRVIVIYMYHIICLHVLVEWEFFASSYLHLHWLRCRARIPWTPWVRPQHQLLHTIGTLRGDTCPLITFPMPALSPPAMLKRSFPSGKSLEFRNDHVAIGLTHQQRARRFMASEARSELGPPWASTAAANAKTAWPTGTRQNGGFHAHGIVARV